VSLNLAHPVDEKELKNVDQYEDLARELRRLWKV